MDWPRIAAARNLAKSLLIVGGLLTVFGTALVLTTPWYPVHGTGSIIGIPLGPIVHGLAIAGLLTGLAWMWRIYRAPTELGKAPWRYRDR